jgi:hypothetical protein
MSYGFSPQKFGPVEPDHPGSQAIAELSPTLFKRMPPGATRPGRGEIMPSFAPSGIPGREKAVAPMPRVRPNLPLPVSADPEDPLRVIRSHLQKDELGKSKGSCRAALVTRLHRTAALQEFWCNSYEEQQVCIIIAGHPEVVNLREQWTRVGYLDDAGNERHTRVDFHVLLASSAETLVSVKYDEKARRRSYLAEVRAIAAQTPRALADRFAVVSRFSFHPVQRKCAEDVHHARRGWDPEADRIVLEAAHDLGATFTFQQLLDRAALENRGWRAAVRLIGDGDLAKHLLDPFAPDTLCRLRRV